jgi:MFS family permease
MHGSQFQTAVSLFFVTYVICTLPSNLLLKRLRPSRYLCFLTISWGFIATFTGLVQSYGALLGCRLILGIVEAGLFPGCVVYLTCFYTKNEIALRVGYLACCSGLAGMCGGLLAMAIGDLDGKCGMSGWRWILIIEGMPTVILGVAIYFLLPDDFEVAYFLTEEDKKLLRLRWAHQTGHTKSSRSLHKPDVKKGFKDWRIWVFATGQFASDVCLYSYATFLPTIIKGLSTEYKTAQIQGLTVPCYVAGIGMFLIIANLSDRQQLRGLYTVITCCIALIGYVILCADLPSGAHYAGCIIVALGAFVANLMPLAWLPTNCPRYGKRAVANGMQITIGNIGGAISPFVSRFLTDDGPVQGSNLVSLRFTPQTTPQST